MAFFSRARKKKQKASSSSTINDLPLEILLEILYKLPTVEELHRNKIVCKLWLSLISHHSFGSEYSVRRNSSSSLHAIRPTITLYYTYYHYFSEFYSVERLTMFQNGENSITMSRSKDKGVFLSFDYNVLASSNGLLLCRKSCHGFGTFYYVCNPVTKHWFPLPPPPTFGLFGLWGIVCFPNSESVSGTPQTQFKVVKIVSDRDTRISPVLNMEIFESGTNQWRVLTTTLLLDATNILSINLRTTSAIEHRGILYWLKQRQFIIAFDPNLVLCRQISLPGSRDNIQSLLGVSQDHLYYVHIDFNTQNIPCTIWRCDEFEGEYTWSVHGRFDLNWISHHGTSIFLEEYLVHLKVLAIDPTDCNILYISIFLRKPLVSNRLYYSLDLRRRETRELHCSKDSRDNSYINNIVMLVQPIWPTTVP